MRNYKGGFSTIGRGTPEGDGKDKAMRAVSYACIVELKEGYRASSSATTLEELGFWSPNAPETGHVIMLARNGGLAGQPLRQETVDAIVDAHRCRNTFVVGDMPGVDSPFHAILDSIGAEYVIYHAGTWPRC